MDPGSVDRRVRRTRELLRGALISLIQEKGYDRITVQDILDRADIGRSTFYAHYRDKDDLLRSGFEEIDAALAAERASVEQESVKRSEFLHPLLAVFRHVEHHRGLWGALTQKGGAELVTRILHEGVEDITHEHFRSQFPEWKGERTELEAAKQLVIGSCMGVLIWWLENDVSYSADQVHSVFRRMSAPGVKRFLSSA